MTSQLENMTSDSVTSPTQNFAEHGENTSPISEKIITSQSFESLRHSEQNEVAGLDLNLLNIPSHSTMSSSPENTNDVTESVTSPKSQSSALSRECSLIKYFVLKWEIFN